MLVRKYLKAAFYPAVFFLFYILLPFYLAAGGNKFLLRALVIFYLANTAAIIYFLKKSYDARNLFAYRAGQLEERINLLNADRAQEQKNSIALKGRISRYNSLKKIVEEINQNLDLDYVAGDLVLLAFSLISNDRGVCILYLVDEQTQKLSLFKAKKEDKELIIKEKEGDIFDLWVLRHTTPLLVENIKKDFRFDLEKLFSQDTRQVSSLVSAPLVSGNRLLGILRLDHSSPAFYSQSDLRFLVTICDLGAVALENSELFRRTQELAIHDSLTSLYTKGYFLENLQEECARSLRSGSVFSLLMLDIDHFKDYNDKFGHTAGDFVLKTLGRVLTESLKDSVSLISRFGGEEFCIILRQADKKRSSSVAAKLRLAVEKEKIILRRNETNITVSIGLAAFPSDASDGMELIRKADAAMYEAKEKGRNRVCSS